MIIDHITYLKQVIEGQLRGRNGITPFAGKFFEIYPKPSTIVKSAPCAALRHLTGKTSFHGGFDRTVSGINEIRRYRRINDVDASYQVDMYSKDIYDFIERDGTYVGLLNQFINYCAVNRSFVGLDGSRITVEPGPFGVIDDEAIIVDGVYKAYCRIAFSDGIYAADSAQKMPSGIENFNIEV